MGELDFGTVATFNCSLGFSLVGEPESVCSGDGSSTVGVFVPEPPICERKFYFFTGSKIDYTLVIDFCVHSHQMSCSSSTR